MGLGNQDIRKSSRIRERAHRLLSHSPYFLAPARIPYHQRICTFGVFDNTLPVSHDILIPRPSSPITTPIDMAEEGARVEKVEKDVGELKSDVWDLKTDVGLINEKLDKLISGLTDRPQPKSPVVENVDSNASAMKDGVPGNTEPAKSSTAQPSHRHRAPDNVSRQMSMDAYVQAEMDRDKFHYQATGKNSFINDINSPRIISKPYMYLYREGVNTVKQKLECRYSMSAMEYVDATLALLADTRAYDPLDHQDIMCHLRKVSRDSLERPWPAVRRWSQHIWDEIESGNITWLDKDLIQDERIRICLTAPVSNTQGIGNATRNRNSQETLCRLFNSKQGCPHRESHIEGNFWAIHCCSYCDSVGKMCNHSVRECERRITHARPFDNNQFNRRQHGYNSQFHNQGQNIHQQNGMFQPAYNQQTHMSKNGY